MSNFDFDSFFSGESKKEDGLEQSLDKMLSDMQLAMDTAPAPVKENKPVKSEAKPKEKKSEVVIGKSGNAALDAERAQIDQSVLGIFLESAASQVKELKKEWLDIAHYDQVTNDLLSGFKRAVHTFKGDAGMLGAKSLHDLSHNLETELTDMEEGRLTWADCKAGISASVEDIEEWVNWVQTPEYIPQLKRDKIAANQMSIEEIESPSVERARSTSSTIQDSFVRLRSKSVDALLQEIGVWGSGQTALRAQSYLMRQMLKDFEEGVEKMQRLLKEVEISAEAQISARKSEIETMGKHFDPLEMDRFTRLQEATRIMAEGVDDLVGLQSQFSGAAKHTEEILQQQQRGVRSAQEVVTEARLTPLDAIGGKLRKVVALAAKETGKKVRLEFVGDETKMDRAVLEKMTAPLEHLLRNAVAHGIESPEGRALAKKPEMGTIWVEATQKEGTIVIACRDDGAGVNTEKVKQKAIEKGLLTEKEFLADYDIDMLIFKPGFSTAEAVSNIAGRGVGMDVVKTEVEQLGGQIQMISTLGQGTSFLLEVPLTIATSQVLVVKSGDEEWALPAQHVKEVLSVKEKELEEAYLKNAYKGGQIYHLADLLSPRKMKPTVETYNTIIHFNLGGRDLFIQVDKLSSSEDVVIRPLAKPLSLVQGFSGTAYLGEGRVGLLLQPFALLARKERTQEKKTQNVVDVKRDERVEAKTLTAMVVDDSLTVRKVTGDLLRSKGIRVILAKDGVDALEKLQNELPDIMLVDLEMPRMNGFELVEHIRNTPKFSHLPVVMITSRTAEKHQETAKNLGVNAYLGKPYQEKELMDQMAHWTKHPFFDRA